METHMKSVQLAEESYPIDADFLDYNTLKKSADDFMKCPERNCPSENDCVILPSGTKVKISPSNIERLSIFGDSDPVHTILALCDPNLQTHVVAVYLNGKWWPVSDVLKTSSTSSWSIVFGGAKTRRCMCLATGTTDSLPIPLILILAPTHSMGLFSSTTYAKLHVFGLRGNPTETCTDSGVRSVGEKVVLFLLSQVIFGVLERPPDLDTYFAPHPEKEVAKILWKDGEAAGFYTVKEKGDLCDTFSGQSYLLPVLDTLFVRKRFRRQGLALNMLQDFCESHNTEEFVGISSPVSSSMCRVCRKHLLAQERDRDRLYEVEAPGGWAQRCNMWLKLQLSDCSSKNSSDDAKQSEVESESIVSSDRAEKGPDLPNGTGVDSNACQPRRSLRRKRTGERGSEEEIANSKQCRI